MAIVVQRWAPNDCNFGPWCPRQSLKGTIEEIQAELLADGIEGMYRYRDGEHYPRDEGPSWHEFSVVTTVRIVAIDTDSEPAKPGLLVSLEDVVIENKHETIRPTSIGRGKPGALVAVRPCDPKYEDRTVLGIYLCSAPTSVTVKQDGDTIVLSMVDYTNPAIYIPETDEIVWGYGSWWTLIDNKDKLRQITDENINSAWYVKALRQIQDLVDADNDAPVPTREGE